ncbi:hypothetical protein AAGG49_23015, partial [Stenotrophomonas maltophilia]|uniref:hypothetical protein n=1 Tax=Stenotrophomonas maltophilia TaxID=40324 RepID=UPI00313BB18D
LNMSCLIDEWMQGVTLFIPIQLVALSINERDDKKEDFIVLSAYNAILHFIDGKSIGVQHRL